MNAALKFLVDLIFILIVTVGFQSMGFLWSTSVLMAFVVLMFSFVFSWLFGGNES